MDELQDEERFILEIPEGESVLSGPMLGTVAKWGLGIGIVVFFVAILATPPFRRHHPNSREKACYANMRVLLGAIEMYNMDNSIMLNGVNPVVLDTLVAQKYLKTKINRPEVFCDYSSIGDLTGDGRIECRAHGTVE